MIKRGLQVIIPALLLTICLTHPGSAQTLLGISLKTIDGQYVRLHDLKGEKLTVLDFWATWCKPCIKSIPELVKLSKNYDNEQVAFIGIDEDSPRNMAKVRPFANSLKIDYPVLLDTEQELYNELQVSVLPTFIILDGDGKVLFTHEGYTKGDEQIFEEKIEEFLANGQ